MMSLKDIVRIISAIDGDFTITLHEEFGAVIVELSDIEYISLHIDDRGEPAGSIEFVDIGGIPINDAIRRKGFEQCIKDILRDS